MSNHRKNGGLDTETKTMLGLIAVFFLGAVGSYIFGSPILTAVCAGLIVTALLYRFFGGVEGSTFTVATFKASGSVAVFAFVTWFVNGELVKQKPIPTAIPVVEPSPQSWVAIDRNGSPTAVTIGGESFSPDVSIFLSDADWDAKLDSGMIRVTKQEHDQEYDLGKIDFPSLGQLGLFNQMEMVPGRGIRYTGELTAGAEEDLNPVYPYKIRVTQFSDSYNGFSVLDEHNAVILSKGLLRTKNFQFFEHGNEHFLIFVSRAIHNDPQKAPWAVFGFAQVNPTLNRNISSD